MCTLCPESFPSMYVMSLYKWVNLDRCSADITMIDQQKNTDVVFLLCEQFIVVQFFASTSGFFL